MKIAVIIPDRGDRPKFMQNCLRMVNAQSLQPTEILKIDYQPESSAADITQRYRRGYELTKGKGFDLVAFIENDDWYSTDYLEVMVNEWEKQGRPNLIGTCYTYYYHLKLKAYFIMEHYSRASAMNTLIRPDLDLTWPVDAEPYTDLWLWSNVPISRVSIKPPRIISVGMKHNVGLCGGGSHNIENPYDALRYIHPDNGFLEQLLDKESFNFYNNYFNP